jgi:hypothetical protein
MIEGIRRGDLSLPIFFCTHDAMNGTEESNLCADYGHEVTPVTLGTNEDIDQFNCERRKDRDPSIVIFFDVVRPENVSSISFRQMIADLRTRNQPTFLFFVHLRTDVKIPSWLRNEIDYVALPANGSYDTITDAYRNWYDESIPETEFAWYLGSVPDRYDVLIEDRGRKDQSALKRFLTYSHFPDSATSGQ